MRRNFPCCTKEVVCKEVGEKGILLNLRSGAYFEVNPVGLAVWRSCSGKVSPEQIACSISRRYHVGLEEAGRDVKRFLAQLRRHRMLL